MGAEQMNYVVRALALFDEFGQREALVSGERRLTYAELRGTVLDLAAALAGHGVRSGMTVAVALGHPLEGPALLLALHLLGCRTVWVRSGVARREMDEQLKSTRPDAVVYDARSGNPLGEMVGERLGVPTLCLGPAGSGPDLLAHKGSGVIEAHLVGADPDTVFQTSGTTGVPKLVHHRHGYYWQIHRLAEQIVAADEPLWRHLTLSVLGHVSGQISALLYLFCGSTLVLMENWDPAEFLATVERERVNSTFIPPPCLYELLEHPALDRADCTSMRMLSVGAAPASPARLREAIERFGPVLRITYGLSECPFISANTALRDDPADEKRLSSCGRPYGDVRVEIRADDGVTVLGTGEVGELWALSSLNFAGYLEQPERTATTLVDGWVRTRDLGYRDADGYLYLVGRSQDLIITGRKSWKVWPRPIEDVLAAHPQVRAAAVIGVPDPAVVEAVYAYVVAAPGATVTAGELTARVRDELTELWTPRTVEFVDQLPINDTGKVDKNALRERYAATHPEASITAAVPG
jgi:acyl-CoA synthetase (AMP-forming)/AMP-acid ligase II